MRRLIIVLAAVAIAAAMTVGAGAVSAHFKHGSPTFRDNGLTLKMTAALAGLGNYDTQLSLTATGDPTGRCTNPGGESKVPGQNPAPVTTTGSVSVPASDLKNGNVTLNVETSPPTSPIPGAPDCPNSSWSETITNVAFTSASFAITQDVAGDGFANDSPSLQGTCTFSPKTSDGAVPSGSVTC